MALLRLRGGGRLLHLRHEAREPLVPRVDPLPGPTAPASRSPTTTRGARRGTRRSRIIEVCEETSRFYHTMLMRGKDDRPRAYFASRGMGGAVCRRYRLGFAPGRGSLVAHLTEAGFTQQEMIDANVALRRDRGGMGRSASSTASCSRSSTSGGSASRSAAASWGRASPSTSTPPRRPSSTRSATSTASTGPRTPSSPRAPPSWWRATPTPSPATRRASATSWRRSAPRSPRTTSRPSRGSPRRSSTSSTAMRRARRPPSAPSSSSRAIRSTCVAWFCPMTAIRWSF